MESLCSESREAMAMFGKDRLWKKSSEIGNIKFRRSLYFTKDIKKGDVILSDSVRSVRPGYGVAPKHFEKVVGSIAKTNINKNTPVGKEYI